MHSIKRLGSGERCAPPACTVSVVYVQRMTDVDNAVVYLLLMLQS